MEMPNDHKGFAAKIVTGAMGSEDDAGDGKEGLRAAFRDLCEAVKSSNEELGVSALEDFFAQCDKAPHEEGPHTSGPGLGITISHGSPNHHMG